MTDGIPELPDAELKVTATFTPDWQVRSIEKGVVAAVAPALLSMDGLIAVSAIV
ncbi:hypothetical protein GCM10011400_35440 [Paraburkholderia caffeinilytica]|uniref:Uncharacterized protein n=1 Tax=Paraburkholderia caffeinilytica TaxID=1761016 RepID=A0ABQ1MR80_9BURK|nr:hypothetical protein GCM10011400_35440 [Paraburkholderia caffeinilytica]